MNDRETYVSRIIENLYDQTGEKLKTFTKNWLEENPDSQQLFGLCIDQGKEFANHLVQGIELVEDDWLDHLIVYSLNPTSPGFFEFAYDEPTVRGKCTENTVELERVRLKDYGIFLNVDTNVEDPRFVFTFMHETFHLLDLKSSRQTGVTYHPRFQFLEEGYVSFLAKGALNRISHDIDDPSLRERMKIDQYQIVLSQLLDRFAQVLRNKGATVGQAYYEVVQEGICQLMLSRNPNYYLDLMRQSFNEKELVSIDKMLRKFNEYKMENDYPKLETESIQLYNLISKTNFPGWQECMDWRLKSNIPDFRVLYAPNQIILFKDEDIYGTG